MVSPHTILCRGLGARSFLFLLCCALLQRRNLGSVLSHTKNNPLSAFGALNMQTPEGMRGAALHISLGRKVIRKIILCDGNRKGSSHSFLHILHTQLTNTISFNLASSCVTTRKLFLSIKDERKLCYQIKSGATAFTNNTVHADIALVPICLMTLSYSLEDVARGSLSFPLPAAVSSPDPIF